MGEKSFKKRRGGATGDGGGNGGGDGAGGDAGLEPMEVDPPRAVAAARIGKNALARREVVLPSTVQKVKVPSFHAYIDATRAENPEEAIRALNIPDLRGIVSTNEDPRLCAHCSAALEGYDPYLCNTDCTALHPSCGAMVCKNCFADHCRICTSSVGLELLHVKAGAPWALFQYAIATRNWTDADGPVIRRLLELAADAGHPQACHFLSVGHTVKRDWVEFSEESIIFMDFYGRQDISSAAKYAKRALVLDADNYRGKSSATLKLFLKALVKDGRLKDAKALAELLVGFETDEFPKKVEHWVYLTTFEPFYDQLALATRTSAMSHVNSAPSTVTSLYYLDQHDMSPEELRLADYESGDDILRMTCVALKVLSEQFATSSSPLLVGLGSLVRSMHHLMGQPVNRDFYRSIPTIMREVAVILAEVNPFAPTSLLEAEPFLLLMLTSVATHTRMSRTCIDTQVGELDPNFRSITNVIIKNSKIPSYLRALALVTQADRLSNPPHYDYISSNCPREVPILRKVRALSLSVNKNESCPLKALSVRLLIDSVSERLEYLEGPSRHDALEEIASIRLTHGDGSADSEDDIEFVKFNYSDTVGGSGCDQCGKTLPELGVPNLLKCRRCYQAHFCSDECAAVAWDAWHSKSCKTLGVFAVGDLVRVRGISYNKGNGRIRNGAEAVITGKTQDGQWAVKALDPSNDGTYEVDALSSKNLYHLRTLWH